MAGGRNMSNEVEKLSETCLYLAHRLRETEAERDEAWEDNQVHHINFNRVENEKNEEMRIKFSYATIIMAIEQEVVRTDLESQEKIERIYEILSEFGAITYQEEENG